MKVLYAILGFYVKLFLISLPLSLGFSTVLAYSFSGLLISLAIALVISHYLVFDKRNPLVYTNIKSKGVTKKRLWYSTASISFIIVLIAGLMQF